MGTMTEVKAVAAVPMNGANLPRCQGPGLNLLPTMNVLIVIGIVKATKAAKAPIEKIAPIARSPAKIRRVRSIPTMQLNQTALTGVFVCRLTNLIQDEPGKTSSRAYA